MTKFQCNSCHIVQLFTLNSLEAISTRNEVQQMFVISVFNWRFISLFSLKSHHKTQLHIIRKFLHVFCTPTAVRKSSVRFTSQRATVANSHNN